MRRTPSPRTLRSRPLVLLAPIGVLALTAASCGGKSADIGVDAAARGSVVEVVDAPASVTARAAATLTAAADGTLVSLRVDAGDLVRAGQVLAVIDSPSARARLAEARKALAAAPHAAGSGSGSGVNLAAVQRATDRAAADAFAQARAAAGRIADQRLREALLAEVTAAQKRYDAAARTATAAVRAAQRGMSGLTSAMNALFAAQRLQARQAYDLASYTVDALTLRAPISGVVQLGGAGSGAPGGSLTDLLGAAGRVSVSGAGSTGGAVPALPGVDGSVPVGGRVSAGAAILTIVDTSTLGLIAEVDETDVLLVRAGVPASVELDAATGASYSATVRTVDVLPAPSARGGVAYRVRLSLGAGRYADGRAAPTPRPGMSAVVHLRVREVASAVTVPAAAVFSVGGHDAVWLVRDGRAERVAVAVGVEGREVVQILDGVRPGERVVVRGVDAVRSGQRVP